MQSIESILNKIDGWVWGPPLLILLFGTHLFLTFRLGFIQKWVVTRGIKLSFTPDKGSKGDISHFGALTTALAATIGTGNIAGVATAIAAGGPGAVLWMWLTGVFGMATKYAEALLSVHFRVTNEKGEMAGGPMYVLERGMNCRWLGLVFAALTFVASFGIGNMVQASEISKLMETQFQIAPALTGGVLMLLVGASVLGGIRSIAKVCQVLVPFMALFYTGGCLILLLMHLPDVPGAVELIFKSAFTGQAAAGGFLGAGVKEAVRYGIARGLFSNESGMGSAPIIAAAARTKHPVQQALVSSTGTFWDTVVICAMTGLVLVASGSWMETDASGNSLSGSALTAVAFAKLSDFGTMILVGGMFTFVLSTLLGWSYYGEKALEYLAGNTKPILPYRILWVLAAGVGATVARDLSWTFADIANGLMTLPNIVSLLVLSGLAAKLSREGLSKP